MWNTFTVMCLAIFLVKKGLGKIPDFIHPCKIGDVKCLTQSSIDALPEFAKGIPEMGIPVLDPFVIDNLAVPLPGVKAYIYNAKLFGFRKSAIDNVEGNFRKRTFTMDFHGNYSMKGFYKAQGKVLIMPINGDGEVEVKLTNIRMKVTIKYDIVPDDKGINHFQSKGFQYTVEYGHAYFNLTNLFKGSPELSNRALIFMNENWRLVVDEFGKPVIDLFTEIIAGAIEKFFLALPYEELIDGPIPSVRE